jgi:hypothetical protein
MGKVGTRLRMTLQGMSSRVRSDKIQLIDHAYEHCDLGSGSFADLGGVWGVNGAYTFYILRNHRPKSAFLVDTHFNDVVTKKSKSFPNLTLVRGNFGEESVANQVGDVDAVIMFDVLLHQVKPDWNVVLRSYAKHTGCFIILNQQWVGSKTTIRLLDLGREEYLKNVPHSPKIQIYKDLFDKMYEMNHDHNRIWRDIHAVWQWGITDDDLLRTMAELGFKKVYYKSLGNFRTLHGTLKNFEDHAFVFQRV